MITSVAEASGMFETRPVELTFHQVERLLLVTMDHMRNRYSATPTAHVPSEIADVRRYAQEIIALCDSLSVLHERHLQIARDAARAEMKDYRGTNVVSR